ncbi:MAG: carboxypeptidase regulatory-like domain-containing protein [Acidobacteria bacterium]|nr:carboxypeptidase regulatory-like domain-containing protein [Acidobacteriota bacterium]
MLASAQGTTTRFTGTVTDASGAAVAGATVTLTNESTNISLSTTTSASGGYVFDLIQPGTYTISVEREGFKRYVSRNNSAFINQPASVNVALEVGDVSAVVSVEATAEQVQTSTSGNVGSTIEQRTLESLPIVGLRGRNPLDLLNYQPGVVVGANIGGGVHVNGSRDRAFNFTLDGIDINESTAGGSNFTPLRPNPDSVQEFQIVTSNATAELGRSSGAQVTLVTRSGTNRYSGNLFEYYQTPGVNANEFENNLLGIGRPQFVQHIYGGSFGGPIINPGFGEGTPFFQPLKDRAFFFVNLQRLSASETRLAERTVYTSEARSGLYRYIRGQRNAPAGTSTASVNAAGQPIYPACSATITTLCVETYNLNTQPLFSPDPFIVGLLNDYPLPNDFSRGDGLNFAGFNFNAPQTEKQWDLVMRFDVNVTKNSNFYVRYAQGAQDTIGDSVNGGLPAFPGYPNLVNTIRRPKNLAVNYRWSPTPRFTNEFIYGYSTFSFSFANEAPRADVPFILNTVTDAFSNFAYNAREARTFQIVDNITFDFSPHLFKAGINIRLGRQFDDRSSAGGTIEPTIGFGAGQSNFIGFGLPTAGGTTGINSTDLTNLRSQINNWIGRIGSFAQGFVVSPENPNVFAPGGTRWNWRAYYPEYDFYFQDTWRVRPNLTLDLGLRYELKLSPRSKGLPILRPSQPFSIGAAPSNTLRWEEGELFENDTNNFAPSLGFAWDPFGSGKTSIRANYRLSYDRFPSQVFANSVYQSAPGNTFAFSDTSIAQQDRLIRNGIPNATPSSTPNALRQPPSFGLSTVTLVDPDTRYPESHQWFVGFQREIWDGNVFEVNYIGRRGTHLFGGYDSNQVDIFARHPSCPENFLEAFNTLRGSPTATSCLINLLFTGNPTNNAGTTTFRGIGTIATTLTPPTNPDGSVNTTGGGVATAAQVVSQRTVSGQQMIANTINNPFFFQRYPQFGVVNVLDSNDYSRYSGLDFIFKRRLKGGLGFQIGYTWSISKDTRSFDPTFTTVSRANNQSASSTPFDINDRNLNYAWSDFDRRHVINGTYVWEIPIGRDRAYGKDMSRVLDFFVGGWQLAGTYNWGTGRPFTVYSGLNTVSNVNQSFANCNGCSRDLGELVERNGTWYWFSQAAEGQFSQPAPGELGNTGRNYFIGPSRFQTDASLSKNLRFSERYSLDLRVDARNLTNTASFGLPTATFNSSVFGRIRTSVVSASRRIQLSAKFNF